MWDIVGLAGLGASLFAIFWRVITARHGSPSGLAPLIGMVGLTLFIVSITLPTSESNDVPPRVPTSAYTPTLSSEQAITPPSPLRAVRPQCSQPPTFTGDPTWEHHDGAFRYSCMSADSYPWTGTDYDWGRALWVVMGVRNERSSPAQIDPWLDFWVREDPASAISSTPRPLEVHVLEIGGPTPLPIGQTLLFEPGMECSLLLTFQLDADAKRVEFEIGDVPAFQIDLN